ncbi:CHAT domain-containing protein [Dokdonia ponticola]|uniref:CHAT domain-containing protein n=1 Tax=Dokdonia ponticola TaxID=2041041 RepID=A0ABV9HYG7_9FLAO
MMLISSVMNGQSFFDSYTTLKKENTQSLTHIEHKVDSLLSLTEKENAIEEAILITHDFSIQYFIEGDYDKAILYAAKDASYYKKNNLINEAYSNALFNLAFFQRLNFEYEDAIPNYNKVITLNNNPEKVGRSYCDIGLIYNKQNDYYKSLIFFNQGITVFEKQENLLELYHTYVNISQVYEDIATTKDRSKENYSKELYYINKALELKDSLYLNSSDHLILYNTVASYYNTNENYDFENAKSYYIKSLEISKENQDSSKVTTLHLNIGNLFLKQQKRTNKFYKDSIFHYLNTGLQFQTEYNRENISDIYLNFSDYYSHNKEYKKALLNNTIAFQKITGFEIDPYAIPNLSDLEGLQNQHVILNIISEKATILLELYDVDQDISYVELALQNLQVADHLISAIQQRSNQNLSKLFWRNQASYIYLRAVKACAILNKIELAFYFTEKNKAFLLTESILDNNTKSLLPDAISTREQILKERIVTLEKNTDVISKDSLFKTAQILEKFTDSIKIAYPEYFSTKTKTQIISTSEVQKYIDDKSIVISYIWNTDDKKENHYVVLVSKKEIAIHPIDNTEEIDILIKEFQTSISKPFENNNDKDSFQKVAHTLYAHLLPKDITTTIARHSNLMIVPDGKLQNIPFEALISSKETSRYLIEDYRISYAYSMSFLLHNASITRNSNKPFVGFAPITFERDSLKNLNKSEQELKAIHTMIQGDKFINKEATKEAFLSQSKDAKIIHLATHADGTSNPWIAFKDEDLIASELYIYKNQAELVTLSACNTTLGDIAPGEGVMSLARGFFYAGANTVVSSLWETNDKATSEIMTSFYAHLKEGNSKSDALHKAKLAYISSSNLSQQSPYYWAPFILIGEAENSLYTNNTSLIFGVLCIVIFVFMTLLYFKKIKNKIVG